MKINKMPLTTRARRVMSHGFTKATPPFVLLGFLSLCFGLSGCGGGGVAPDDGGGVSVGDNLTLAPADVPESLDTTVRLSAFVVPQGADLTLVIGGQRMGVRGEGDDPRVRIDAFELAPGVHTAVLEAGGQSMGSAQLTVNAQPVIDTLAPSVVVAEGMDPMVLHGSGFRAPMVVILQDDAGNAFSELPATVSDAGDEAQCFPPFPMPAGPQAQFDVQVRCGDGQRARDSRPVTVQRSYRAFDGAGNNMDAVALGNAEIALLRKAPSAYADGFSALSGADRPNARAISNGVCAQSIDEPNSLGATDYVWQWGQFLDHDITLSHEDEHGETAPIAIPLGDPFFDPFETGVEVMGMTRSAYVEDSSPRQQVNAITAFVDASNVYGSSAARALALRTQDGTGRLKTSDGDLLPFNVDGLANAGGPSATLFVAGDIRANEQLGLTCMHTLFVREHNRLAAQIRAADEDLSGDQVYEEARRIVGAQMQVITYEEFLPVMLGRDLGAYRGYDASVDAGIANVFSTAGYRLGHSLLSDTLLRMDADGEEVAEGHLSLRDAFFQPSRLVNEGGIDSVLRGLAAQACQELDGKIVDDLRNFLFGAPGSGGLDLATLNIQRGRDHGLGSYNEVRAAYGLAVRTSFAQVTSNETVQAQLAATYDRVDDIDAWIGGLCEDHINGGLLGELFDAIVADQFERLRAGDRYWYERTFSGRALRDLQETRLSDIIRRNTEIGSELSRNVFMLPLPTTPLVAGN